MSINDLDNTGGCYTRIVTDGLYELELVRLQAVIQRIQNSLINVPAMHRTYVGNALLNLAVKLMQRNC